MWARPWAAGVAKFRQDRQDYNVSVTIHPYRQGRMEDCLHLLDTLAEEVQGIALCAADCPQVRQKLELLAERRMPVVTFNSDIAGARRLCYVGEDAHHAGRVAGDIAAKFLRPGDRMLLVYADHGYAGHKAGRRLSGAACGAGAPAGGLPGGRNPRQL